MFKNLPFTKKLPHGPKHYDRRQSDKMFMLYYNYVHTILFQKKNIPVKLKFYVLILLTLSYESNKINKDNTKKILATFPNGEILYFRIAIRTGITPQSKQLKTSRLNVSCDLFTHSANSYSRQF